MLQCFTVRYITFAVTLFLSFTSLDNALKILFSLQIFGQWSKKPKTLYGKYNFKVPRPYRDLQFENILNRK